MPFFRTVLTTAALVLLPIAGAADTSRPGPDGRGTYSGGWMGAGRKSFHVVWHPALAQDDTVLICGLWTLDNMQLRPGVRQILQRATVFVDGKAVRRSLTGFARAVTVDSMARTEPRCLKTKARGPWKQVEIAFGDGSFRN